MSNFTFFFPTPRLHTRWELISIYFPGKSQSYGFFYSHVWMWKLHNEETLCWRTDAFKLLCWRRFLRVPQTARSNQSILKENNPEYSLEGLMLKLKLQYFGHLMWTAESLEISPWFWEILKEGEGWDGWMASLTQWTWVWANSKRQWRTGKPGVLQSKGSQRVRHNWTAERQQLSRQNTWAI